jgi:hypothetical protein
MTGLLRVFECTCDGTRRLRQHENFKFSTYIASLSLSSIKASNVWLSSSSTRQIRRAYLPKVENEVLMWWCLERT